MTTASLPTDFAPVRLVMSENGRSYGCGRFHDIGVAASTLQFLRRTCPESLWCLVDERGVIDDTKIVPRAFQWPFSMV